MQFYKRGKRCQKRIVSLQYLNPNPTLSKLVVALRVTPESKVALLGRKPERDILAQMNLLSPLALRKTNRFLHPQWISADLLQQNVRDSRDFLMDGQRFHIAISRRKYAQMAQGTRLVGTQWQFR